MSAYSLDEINSQKYFEEFEENIRYSFDSYLLKEHFRIGAGIEDEYELQHNLIYHRIMCSEDCEIVNYIQKKIEGTLEGRIRRTDSLIDIVEYNYGSHNHTVVDTKNYWDLKTW